MLFKASAADINKSRASSEVRRNPDVDNGFGFLPRGGLGGWAGGGAKAELDEASSGEESVMVLSLLESSELESESYTLAVFSLSISSDPAWWSWWRGDGLLLPPLPLPRDNFWCGFRFISADMAVWTGLRLSTLLLSFSAL